MTAPVSVLRPPQTPIASSSADEWAVQVRLAGDVPAGPTAAGAGVTAWQWVLKANKIDPNNAPVAVDDSDVNSGGAGSQLVVGADWSIMIEGIATGEAIAGVLALPGQALLYAAGQLRGQANVVEVRYWRTDNVDRAFYGLAAVKWNDVNAERNNLQKWSAELTGRGARTVIVKPAKP